MRCDFLKLALLSVIGSFENNQDLLGPYSFFALLDPHICQLSISLYYKKGRHSPSKAPHSLGILKRNRVKNACHIIVLLRFSVLSEYFCTSL